MSLSILVLESALEVRFYVLYITLKPAQKNVQGCTIFLPSLGEDKTQQENATWLREAILQKIPEFYEILS